jgi:phosphoribosylformylglycinamidine cyclo-ligase
VENQLDLERDELGLRRGLTYSEAGVDRDLRAESKKTLRTLEKTYSHSRYGEVIELPYGRIFPHHDHYLDLTVEGVGTKVLIAQLVGKYDTIGIDGVAMAVNDVIRSGARPIALVDNIHMQVSDPVMIKELINGITRGAEESECIVPGGEIGDAPDLIKGLASAKGFDIVVASVGEVAKEKVILGRDIQPGDPIIGLKSSGVHSNGISLVRKALFRQWGGIYDANAIADGLHREIGLEALEPTRIYVKPFCRLAEKMNVKGAVHITGDAYLKFERLSMFSPGIGFEFDNFKPQPIFGLIQQAADKLHKPITDDEMFKTFNMGWGFAVITSKIDCERALEVLEKAGAEPEQIGCVTSSRGVKIRHKNKKIILN